MGIVDFWYIHRERILVCIGATLMVSATLFALTTTGSGDSPYETGKRIGYVTRSAILGLLAAVFANYFWRRLQSDPGASWREITPETFVAGGVIALTLAILVGPTPGAAEERLADSREAAAECERDGNPIANLPRGSYQELTPQDAAGVNPRLAELGPTAGWPSVYLVKNGQSHVYVSILEGARNGFDDTLNDITSAAYGPGTAIMPARVLAYEGYEIQTPGLKERTVAFETGCDHVGIYARNRDQARVAAERLLPVLDG